MRSRSVHTTNIRIGKRFTERIGYELHQAATYALKQDWENAERIYQEVEQMLDTFLTETGIGKYIEEQANERAKVEVPAARVAAEGKPAPKSKRAPKKDPKGAATSKRASDPDEGADG